MDTVTRWKATHNRENTSAIVAKHTKLTQEGVPKYVN